MTDQSPSGTNDTTSPAAEILQPQTEDVVQLETEISSEVSTAQTFVQPHRAAYRPSHKATFIGLTAIVTILVINVIAVTFVMRSQAKADTTTNQDAVTLSPETLDKLGVSRDPIGTGGAQLVVNPNSRFNGTVTVEQDMTVAGQLKLNGKFSAPEASFAKLQAGDTALEKVNINGEATASDLNLRKDLTVVGSSRLQGPVTMSQLLTVNNNASVSGNLAVGGILSVRSLHVASFVTDTTLTIGGHVITAGLAPSVSAGSVGSNGTVSLSGTDAAGTVAVNVGAGGGSGVVANVTFRSQYATTPHVVVTAIGSGAGSVYVNRTSAGFSIGVNGSVGPGGYAFDYIVVQ